MASQEICLGYGQCSACFDFFEFVLVLKIPLLFLAIAISATWTEK